MSTDICVGYMTPLDLTDVQSSPEQIDERCKNEDASFYLISSTELVLRDKTVTYCLHFG
jgi:hypothetical protein